MHIRSHKDYKKAMEVISAKILLNGSQLVAKQKIYSQDKGIFSSYDLAPISVESLDLINSLIAEFVLDKLATILITTPADERNAAIQNFLQQAQYLAVAGQEPCFCISSDLAKEIGLTNLKHAKEESTTLGALVIDSDCSRDSILRILDNMVKPKIDAFAEKHHLSKAQREHLHTKYYFINGMNTHFTQRILNGDTPAKEGEEPQNPQIESLTASIANIYNEYYSLRDKDWKTLPELAEIFDLNASTIGANLKQATTNLAKHGTKEEDVKKTVQAPGKASTVTLISPVGQEEIQRIRDAIEARVKARKEGQGQAQR